MKLQTAELFCGTQSFSKVARVLGHATYTIDNNPRHAADVIADIRKVHESPSGAAPSMVARLMNA